MSRPSGCPISSSGSGFIACAPRWASPPIPRSASPPPGTERRRRPRRSGCDGRLPALGERLYFALGAFSADASEDDYHAHRIGLGVPEGGRDFGFMDAFPHEALMDQLGGVDFRKGCYVGQEVVSRMQHRGTARTRILPLVFAEGAAPAPGTEVVAGARSLGVTGSMAGGRGLATIRLDRLGDALAAGEPVRADGRIAGVEKPAFATFAFPADTAAAG
jgi:folate-binding protein YgfZ